MAMLVIVAAGLPADPMNMLNLRPPSGLEAGQTDARILHRFFGNALSDPLGTVFGIISGANAEFGLRHMFAHGIEADLAYCFLFGEVTAGAAWRYHAPKLPIAAEASIDLFTFLPNSGIRAGGVFGAVSVSTDPLFGRLVPAIVAGYDSYYNRVGFGAALLVYLLQDRAAVVQNVSLLLEAYPPFGIGGTRNTAELGTFTAVAAGLRLDTLGHNFILEIGNSYQIGERRWMAGATGSSFLGSLHLGFNIHRRFPY